MAEMAKIDINRQEIRREIRSAVREAFEDLPIEQRMEKVEELIEKLSKLITGNGNPENGLVIKTDRNTTAIREMRDSAKKRADREWGIWVALIVSIVGSVLQLVLK